MIDCLVLQSIIRSHVEDIIDFVFDQETGETFAEKLNNAWYELVSVRQMIATISLRYAADPQCRQSFDELERFLESTCTTVEILYSEAINNPPDETPDDE